MKKIKNKKRRSEIKIFLLVLIAIALLLIIVNSDTMLGPTKKIISPAECADSDGGKIHSVQGMTCFNSGSLQNQRCSKDECASTKVLYEYYCSEEGIRMDDVMCNFGCGKGICKNIQRALYLHRGADGSVNGKGVSVEISTIPRKEIKKEFDDFCMEDIYGNFSNLEGFILNANELEGICDIEVDVQETFVITGSDSMFIKPEEVCIKLDIGQGTFAEQTTLVVQEITISGCDVRILEFLGIFKELDFQAYGNNFEENKEVFFELVNSWTENCRNGVVDDFEQCDIGEDSDNHGAVCTEECLLPFCGDGYVNQEQGVEGCDTYEFSNGEEYFLNPTCGELYGGQAGNQEGLVYCNNYCILDNTECEL